MTIWNNQKNVYIANAAIACISIFATAAGLSVLYVGSWGIKTNGVRVWLHVAAIRKYIGYKKVILCRTKIKRYMFLRCRESL